MDLVDFMIERKFVYIQGEKFKRLKNNFQGKYNKWKGYIGSGVFKIFIGQFGGFY